MLPVTDLIPLPLTMSRVFCGEAQISSNNVFGRISAFETKPMLKLLDLHSFRTLFGQFGRRCSPTSEEEHDNSEKQHENSPPQVHIEPERASEAVLIWVII